MSFDLASIDVTCRILTNIRDFWGDGFPSTLCEIKDLAISAYGLACVPYKWPTPRKTASLMQDEEDEDDWVIFYNPNLKPTTLIKCILHEIAEYLQRAEEWAFLFEGVKANELHATAHEVSQFTVDVYEAWNTRIETGCLSPISDN